VTRAKNGDAWIAGSRQKLSPRTFGDDLQKLPKQAAEDHLGEKITDAVITVRPTSTMRQRQATKDAGAIAGLNVEHHQGNHRGGVGVRLERRRTDHRGLRTSAAERSTSRGSKWGEGIVEVKATNGDNAPAAARTSTIASANGGPEFKKAKHSTVERSTGRCSVEGRRGEGQDRALAAPETEINLRLSRPTRPGRKIYK